MIVKKLTPRFDDDAPDEAACHATKQYLLPQRNIYEDERDRREKDHEQGKASVQSDDDGYDQPEEAATNEGENPFIVVGVILVHRKTSVHLPSIPVNSLSEVGRWNQSTIQNSSA